MRAKLRRHRLCPAGRSRHPSLSTRGARHAASVCARSFRVAEGHYVWRPEASRAGHVETLDTDGSTLELGNRKRVGTIEVSAQHYRSCSSSPERNRTRGSTGLRPRQNRSARDQSGILVSGFRNAGCRRRGTWSSRSQPVEIVCDLEGGRSRSRTARAPLSVTLQPTRRASARDRIRSRHSAHDAGQCEAESGSLASAVVFRPETPPVRLDDGTR